MVYLRGADAPTIGQSIELVFWDFDRWLSQTEERYNGLCGVATDHWDDGFRRVTLASDALDKGLCANNIKGGHTEEALWVEDASIFEDLGGNGDSGVDRVGDDENECLRGVLCDAFDKTLYDASVDLEEVIASHSRLA